MQKNPSQIYQASSSAGKSPAKSRREKENIEFVELSRLLPLPGAIASQIDKASIIRLASSYLKMRLVLPDEQPALWSLNRRSTGNEATCPAEREAVSHLLQTLDGFILIIGPDSKILYSSETASVYLGLSQVELIGNNILEYIHPNDHDEFTSVFTPQKYCQLRQTVHSIVYEEEKQLFVRMKCVLAKRNAGHTSSGYKVIRMTGYLKAQQNETGYIQQAGLLALAQPLPPTSNTDMKLYHSIFLFRTTLELKFVFLDQKCLQHIGYDTSDMLETSLYHVIHPNDLSSIVHSHELVLLRGQVTTKYYRILIKGGEHWIWVQSHVTLINNNRASRPQCLVWVNDIIGSTQVDSYSDFSALNYSIPEKKPERFHMNHSPRLNLNDSYHRYVPYPQIRKKFCESKL